MAMESRFPAEWEPLSGVILAWPHAGTDWAPRLAEVEQAYAEAFPRVGRARPSRLSGSGYAEGDRAGSRADLGRGAVRPRARVALDA